MTATAAAYTLAVAQAAHDHAFSVMIAAEEAAYALDMRNGASWYDICEARRVVGVATLDFHDAREALQAARGDA
jgi:hypothetical protein